MKSRLQTIGILALSTLAIVSLARPASASPQSSTGVTADSTPAPGISATLVGHVVWEGRKTQPDVTQQLPITLRLTRATDPGEDIEYTIKTTDANGNFRVTVGALTPGKYAWNVKGPQYLSKSGSVMLGVSQETYIEPGLMLAGDANNDNAVSAADFNILRSAFGKDPSQLGYDVRADFTGDLVVNISDSRLLIRNFGRGGN